LIDPHFPQSPTVIRCEITDEGSLGILMVEGHKRSPRLDDLEASLYDLAIDNIPLSKWLVKSEKSQREGLEDGFVNVGVGLGCSSNTLKLADDIVSFHASFQSMLIKKIISDPHFQPGILVSILEGSTATTSHTYFTPVKDYRTLIAGETAGWRFRIKESLIRDLTEKAQGASPNETGGFLIGRINQRSKTVHITRLLDAPKDSVGFPYGFIFGVEDAPQILKDISSKTGGQIYYVGEWHSHPAGGKSLSNQDLSAMQQIKKSLDKIGQPTIIMVVTKTGCFPYLFPAD
jgi:proteasome lid subunit RPN8/RPN11